MAKRWIIYTNETVSCFEAVPASETQTHDFDDPTTYPMATALPLVFDNLKDAARCVLWLERLVGKLAMAGKIAPTTVNNYQPLNASDLAQMVMAQLERHTGDRR